MLFCIFVGVAIDIHYSLDSDILGGIYEYAQKLLVILENVICGSSHDYTAALIGNLFNYLVLCDHGTLNNIGAEIKAVKHSGELLLMSAINSLSSPLSCAARAVISL